MLTRSSFGYPPEPPDPSAADALAAVDLVESVRIILDGFQGFSPLERTTLLLLVQHRDAAQVAAMLNYRWAYRRMDEAAVLSILEVCSGTLRRLVAEAGLAPL
jgi:ATP-dependent helicase/DNAse subunit B